MILDDCLDCARTIRQKSEAIEEIKILAYAPKGQSLTGMPRSGSMANQMEVYIERKETLENDLRATMVRREDLWWDAFQQFQSKNANIEYIMLMWYRYYNGLRWKDCAYSMQSKYPDSEWNEDKCYRINRIMRKYSRI